MVLYRCKETGLRGALSEEACRATSPSAVQTHESREAQGEILWLYCISCACSPFFVFWFSACISCISMGVTHRGGAHMISNKVTMHARTDSKP